MNKIRFIKWGEIPRLGSNKNERMLISFDLKEHRFVKMATGGRNGRCCTTTNCDFGTLRSFF